MRKLLKGKTANTFLPSVGKVRKKKRERKKNLDTFYVHCKNETNCKETSSKFVSMYCISLNSAKGRLQASKIFFCFCAFLCLCWPHSIHDIIFVAVLLPSLRTRSLGGRLQRCRRLRCLRSFGVRHPEARVDAALHVVPGLFLGHAGDDFLEHV